MLKLVMFWPVIGYIASALLLKSGLDLTAKIVFAISAFTVNWIKLFLEGDVLTYCVFTTISTQQQHRIIHLAVASFLVVPIIFMYDGRALKIANGVMLGVNFLSIAIFLLWLIPTELVVLMPKRLRFEFFNFAALVLEGTIIRIYSDSFSGEVYQRIQQMAARLEASTREKGTFFATISHELRNPLQVLLGSLELISDRPRADLSENVVASSGSFDCGGTGGKKSDSSSLLEICKNCCESILNLVSNILDMSKIAAGKMQLSPVDSSLRDIVNRVVRISRVRAEAKNVKLSIMDCPRLAPSVHLDPQRIEQVVNNIVTNSIKFTSKGRIVVKLDWIPIEDNLQDPSVAVKEALATSSWKQVMELEEDACGDTSLELTNRPASIAIRRIVSCRHSIDSRGDNLPQDKSMILEPAVAAQRGIAKIEVMDTGIGISKVGCGKLFHAYQQANASISRYDSRTRASRVERTEEPDSACGSPREYCSKWAATSG